jgi:hypothetical protein
MLLRLFPGAPAILPLAFVYARLHRAAIGKRNNVALDGT